jgi:thiol:disulfide interchange protein DsbC
MPIRRRISALFLGAICWSSLGFANEAVIRKNIAAQLPQLPPIDEVTLTPLPGIWEVRMGSEIFYTDAQANFVIEGNIIDLKKQLNLTEDRIAKLTAFDFAKLPLQDAVVWKQGTGARKLVVFADPNCGYCKHFEKEITKVTDITVYTFVIPILGGDSPDKARDIWCAKDRGKTWREWMLDGKVPPAVPGACDTGALTRNMDLSTKHGVNVTPTLVFADSKRGAGFMSAADLEERLAAAGAP